jgi:predicted metal-binding protein
MDRFSNLFPSRIHGASSKTQSSEPEKGNSKEQNAGQDGDELIKVALALGAGDARWIEPDQVAVREWVRFKCQYGCNLYAKRLTCPPFTPSVEEVKSVLSEYKKILILKFEQHSITEEDGEKFIREFNKRQKNVNDVTLKVEKELMLKGYYKVFALEPGSCNRCDECTAQPGKCRFPTEARPSPESLAIDMFETVKNAGWSMEVKTEPNQNWTNYALIFVE